MRGTITYIHPAGWGLITLPRAEANAVWFHFNKCNYSPIKGDRVVFDRIKNKRGGYKAINIQLDKEK